ncbi:MAG: CvpA family protein [Pseudomonadota bacterium]
MTGFDYTIIGIAALSILLGLWRGLVYEVLSLLGWVAAYLAARLYAADVAPLLPVALGAEAIRMAVAFILLFVVTMIVSGILAWFLSKVVKWVGLGWLDRALGALFGTLRALALAVLLVLLAGLSNLPQESWWRHAWLSGHLEKMALAARIWLPYDVAQRVHY